MRCWERLDQLPGPGSIRDPGGSGERGCPTHLHVQVVHPDMTGPLTWQTWVRGSVDSGRQVEAAVGKPWDGPAGPFRRLQSKHWSRVWKITDPGPAQVHPIVKANCSVSTQTPFSRASPSTVLSAAGQALCFLEGCAGPTTSPRDLWLMGPCFPQATS